jgi:hypothetical protein
LFFYDLSHKMKYSLVILEDFKTKKPLIKTISGSHNKRFTSF